MNRIESKRGKGKIKRLQEEKPTRHDILFSTILMMMTI